MITCKEGVELKGLRNEMTVALQCIALAYSKFGQGCTITSGTEGFIGDGVHRIDSKHYTGDALDFRTRMFKVAIFGFDAAAADAIIERLAQTIRNSLTLEYNVVVESTHIHVEFDPK